MKSFNEIEKMLILEALECYENVMVDYVCTDPEESERFVKEYGFSAEVGLYVLRGMIRELGLGTEGRQRNGGTILRTAIEDLGSSVIECAADSLVNMEFAFKERLKLNPAEPDKETTVETVSVQETSQRTVQRTLKSNPDQRPYESLPTFKWMVQDIMSKTKRQMTISEVENEMLRRWPTASPSESTVGSALSSLAKDDESGVYHVGLKTYGTKNTSLLIESTSKSEGRRAGTSKCNQCDVYLSFGEMLNHKRTEHPVSDNPRTDDDERSLTGSTLRE